MYKTIIFVACLSLMLYGCSIFRANDSQETITIHPELPRPIGTVDIDWIVIESEDGTVYMASKYDDFLRYINYTSDIARYIQQSKEIVCYYRRELNENYCKIVVDTAK